MLRAVTVTATWFCLVACSDAGRSSVATDTADAPPDSSAPVDTLGPEDTSSPTEVSAVDDTFVATDTLDAITTDVTTDVAAEVADTSVAGDVEVVAPSGDFCSADGWCWVEPTPQGNDLRGVYVHGARAWAVGDAGTIVAFDGATWSLAASGGPDLHAVDGVDDALWAVGDDGVIRRFDGLAWSSVASPTDKDLRGVWVESRDAAWAVGLGAVLRYADGAWSDYTALPFAANLQAVWGRAHDDVWAVGEGYDGTVFHWDGAAWTEAYSNGPSAQLYFGAVWGASADEVWIGTEFGYASIFELIASDPPEFDEVSSTIAATSGVTGVWGRARDDVWGVGHYGVAHYDGEDWIADEDRGQLQAVSGHSDGTVWAVGFGGLLERRAGGAWQSFSTSDPDQAYLHFHGLTGSGPDDVWAIGPSGLYRFDGAGMTRVREAQEIGGLWVARKDDVWAFLDDQVERWNGQAWSVHSQLDETVGAFWGAPGSDGDLWVKGQFGVRRRDGTSWPEVAVPDDSDVEIIFGSASDDVWLAGSSGHVVHWDGESFSASNVALPDNSLTTWLGGTARARDDAWLVGFDGEVAHWDGESWTVTPVFDRGTLHAVHAFGPDDVWIAGGEYTGGHGVVFHFDGQSWQPSETHVGHGLASIWGASSADLWIAGGNASVLRRRVP